MTEIHLMSLFLTCLSSINGSNSNWLSRMMTFSSWIQQEGWTRRSPSRGLEIRNLQQEKDSSPQTILTVRAGDANSWVVGYLWRYQPYWNWKCYLDSEVSLLDGPVQWLPPLHRPLTRLDVSLQINQRHLRFPGLLWKIWHFISQNKSWDPCILVRRKNSNTRTMCIEPSWLSHLLKGKDSVDVEGFPLVPEHSAHLLPTHELHNMFVLVLIARQPLTGERL